MIKNWDFKKHIIVSVILSICVVLITYILIKPTGASSMGIITSNDGSGPNALYYTNDTYKVLLSGSVAFVLSMISYLLLNKNKN